MQADVLQENLVEGLNLVARAVSIRAQIPILDNILITASKGQLTIVAGDGEISIQTSVGGKIESDGEICLPARTFVELIGSLPASKIELKTYQTSLEIKSGGFKGKISTVPATEYPRSEKKGGLATTEFKAKELKEALDKVIFAAAVDQSRPTLTGILFRPKKDRIQMVATDAFRLSLVEIASRNFSGEETIIPAKALGELLRIIASKEIEIVKLGLSPGEVLLELGETKIFSRVIAGTYPNFEKIIPTAFNLKATLVASSFAQCLKTAAVFARNNSNIVRLVISKNKVSLLASAPQLGEQEQELEGRVDEDSSEELEIAFNYKYLLDLLGSTASDELGLELSTPLSPAVFKIPGDSAFLHIIMPVRVQS